ncbi:MAG: hypothetical protein E5V73_00175, partial [Mesorhizobium sp.]
TIHARHIASDTGWKISLDRGLDIFQKCEMGNAFSLANRLRAYRQVKAFEVTYLKIALVRDRLQPPPTTAPLTFLKINADGRA